MTNKTFLVLFIWFKSNELCSLFRMSIFKKLSIVLYSVGLYTGAHYRFILRS